MFSQSQTCTLSWKTKESFSPFLGLRKAKGVHLSDTQKLQLRSELEPVPLDSGLANPSIEWQGVNSTVQQILCLCRLHNFCINQRLDKLSQDGADELFDEESFPIPTTGDHFDLLSHGAIPLEQSPTGMNDHSPEQILHGGEHYKGVPHDVRCRIKMAAIALAGGVHLLPREALHQIIAEKDLKRPPIRRRHSAQLTSDWFAIIHLIINDSLLLMLLTVPPAVFVLSFVVTLMHHYRIVACASVLCGPLIH